MGFLVMQALAEKLGLVFKNDRRFFGKIALYQHIGTTHVFLMPMTYMNLSGESIQKVASFYKIDPEQTLVVTDDVALPFGKLRLREKGSAGGHKGLSSAEVHLNTQNFPRLKVGIGNVLPGFSLEEYVLGRFMIDELQTLPKICKQCADAVCLILEVGVVAAMNQVNAQIDTNKQDPSLGSGYGPTCGPVVGKEK